MQTRRLGSQGLEVAAIGLGCMPMTAVCGAAPDRKTMVKLLRN